MPRVRHIGNHLRLARVLAVLVLMLAGGGAWAMSCCPESGSGSGGPAACSMPADNEDCGAGGCDACTETGSESGCTCGSECGHGGNGGGATICECGCGHVDAPYPSTVPATSNGMAKWLIALANAPAAGVVSLNRPLIAPNVGEGIAGSCPLYLKHQSFRT